MLFRSEDAFSPAEVKEVIGQIDPFEFNVTEALKGLDGGKFFISRAEEITFTTHLVTQSDILKKFSKHEVFSKLCKDLIGPNVRLYWDQAVYKKPGTKDEFPWHQDNGYTFIQPQAYLTCWVALTDTDETNGCPCVLPGLHRSAASLCAARICFRACCHCARARAHACDPCRGRRREAACPCPSLSPYLSPSIGRSTIERELPQEEDPIFGGRHGAKTQEELSSTKWSAREREGTRTGRRTKDKTRDGDGMTTPARCCRR